MAQPPSPPPPPTPPPAPAPAPAPAVERPASRSPSPTPPINTAPAPSGKSRTMTGLATPTVRIAEGVHPAHIGEEDGYPHSPLARGMVGGIYHSRAHSQISLALDRRSTRRMSHDRRTETTVGDLEEGDDWRQDKSKRKQIFRGTTLLWLAYQSVGVIYGDIGTSILYVFSSTFTETPSPDEIVQVLSLIIWTITFVVTIKYVFIILNADNEGEGGTFSTYSLLTRYANISNRDPKEQGLVNLERHQSIDMHASNRTVRSTMENSKLTRGMLKAIGVLAVSMVMSDGVLTPAQSVLGAVQGLSVVKPDISSATVVGTSCAILVLLFAIQPLGTSKLAALFAPIVIIWLGFNAGFGIYNLVKWDWTVLKAFNPYYAFAFFINHGTEGWKMLGGVLLAFTGVEALFADLGAFSMRAIQLSWCLYTFPCLLLAYTGQAAFLSMNPDKYTNPLFNSVPPGMLYPTLVIAVLAAIVASQAIITATFQLISQIMKLSYCPQVKVVHTSETFHGQLYVPFLNWLLMLGSILVTAVYSNTTRLGNAYGVCVMFVTFFDTCFVTLVALIVWKFPAWAVALPWLVFALIDGLYLSSALIKVPDGAWFTLTISAILTGLFLLWRFGKESQWQAEKGDRFGPSHLVRKNPEGKLKLTKQWGGDVLNVIRGFGIYFDKTGLMTPSVFTHFVSKFVSVTDITVFCHFHPVETPSVPSEERYSISRFTAVPGCYRLVVKHGFMDEVISPDLAALIYQQVRLFIIRQAREKAVELGEVEFEAKDSPDGTEQSRQATDDGEVAPDDTRLMVDTSIAALNRAGAEVGAPPLSPLTAAPAELRDSKTAEELARLDRAYASKILYVVGKEQMRIRESTALWRRAVLSLFLWIRENTRTKIANLRLSADRVVEVGFVKEL